MVKVSGRTSGEGGSDIDLDEALRNALKAYELSEKMKPEEDDDEEYKTRW